MRTYVMKAAPLFASLAAAALLTLGGCAVLKENEQTEARTQAWKVVKKDAGIEVLVKPGVPDQALSAPRLGTVRTVGTIAADDRAEVDGMTQALQETLAAGLPPAEAGASTLNVTVSDPSPVSPAINVATALLVFWPLDTGAVTVEAELVDASGAPIALWRERLTGGIGLTGSLSRWVKVKQALLDWAKRCATHPAWLRSTAS
jgi:hypothetical protein